jgi:hypothetical protein
MARSAVQARAILTTEQRASLEAMDHGSMGHGAGHGTGTGTGKGTAPWEEGPAAARPRQQRPSPFCTCPMVLSAGIVGSFSRPAPMANRGERMAPGDNNSCRQR